MGYYDGSSMALWQLAREVHARRPLLHGYVRRFFHEPRVACVWLRARYPNAPMRSRAGSTPGPAAAQGRLPAERAGWPGSVGAGRAITPDGYAINTTQPPYQPSGIAPAPGGDPQLADPSRKPLPPQEAPDDR